VQQHDRVGGDVRTHRYRITVSGSPDETAREAFEDFNIQAEDMSSVLAGDLDQAGLHGALNRIWVLGLELVEVRRVPGT
jgi:hypothetical protein